MTHPLQATLMRLAGGACLALPVLLGAPAGADELARYRALAIPTDDAGAAPRFASVSLPAVWQPGDAVAVLVFDPAGAPLRNTLSYALLDSGTGVVEIDARPTAAGPAGPEPLLRVLAGTLTALRQDLGAGPVFALGHGPGSTAAMLAAEPGFAALAGEDGPRFAAVAALGPGPAGYRAGAGAVAAGATAPLCEVLAYAHGAMPTPSDDAAGALARETAARQACGGRAGPGQGLAGMPQLSAPRR
jgi:hypothetical protein